MEYVGGDNIKMVTTIEYQWGDAELPDQDITRNKGEVRHVTYTYFSIRFKDLTPEAQTELKAFFEWCHDPRTDKLHDDYTITKVISLKEYQELPFQ